MTRGMWILLPGVLNVTFLVMCVRMVLKGYPLPVAATAFVLSVLIGNTVMYLIIFIAKKLRGTLAKS